MPRNVGGRLAQSDRAVIELPKPCIAVRAQEPANTVQPVAVINMQRADCGGIATANITPRRCLVSRNSSEHVIGLDTRQPEASAELLELVPFRIEAFPFARRFFAFCRGLAMKVLRCGVCFARFAMRPRLRRGACSYPEFRNCERPITARASARISNAVSTSAARRCYRSFRASALRAWVIAGAHSGTIPNSGPLCSYAEVA